MSLVANEPKWTEGGAACLGQWYLFAPPGDTRLTKTDKAVAKAICRECPMLATCHQWAIKTQPVGVIAAGMDLT